MNDWILWTDINGNRGWYNLKTHSFTTINPETGEKMPQSGTIQDNAKRLTLKAPTKVTYKLKPGESFYTDKRTGKTVVIRPKYAGFRLDTKSSIQRSEAKKASDLIYKKQLEARLEEEALKNINGLFRIMSPASYIGPLFTKGSYIGGLLSGQGFGNETANFVFDLALPVVTKGVSTLRTPRNITAIRQASGVSPTTVNPTYTYGIGDLDIMNQRLSSPGYILHLNLHMTHPFEYFRAANKQTTTGLLVGDRTTYSGSFNRGYTLDQVKDEMDRIISEVANGELAFHTTILRGKTPISQYIAYSTNSPYYLPILSHEWAHSIGFPNADKTITSEAFDLSRLSADTQKYFTRHNSTELSARGTLIKNYLKITDNTPITGELLKLAAKDYIKVTGLDNDMSDFFKSIKDWNKAADWINKYSPAMASPIGLNMFNDERE